MGGCLPRLPSVRIPLECILVDTSYLFRCIKWPDYKVTLVAWTILAVILSITQDNFSFYRRNSSCEKVMVSQACLKHCVRGREGWSQHYFGQTPLPPPPPEHYGIRSTNGRYVSYWNALLPAATKLGQGNIFTSVCLSTGGRGVCLSACWDIPPPPEQTHPGAEPPEQTPPWSRHPPQSRHPSGADTPPEQTPPPPGADTPIPHGSRLPREADSSIRSTSGRYASYWNAFLFFLCLLPPENEVWGR